VIARTWRAWQVGLLGAAVVGLPLLIAAVVLHGRSYFPVLDLAMTEFRVRDVGGSHTPLIGLPGRIGTFPDQGSHPGPLSFWLLAPAYRLLGSSAWAMLTASIVINIAALGVALGLAFRRGGLWLTGGVAVWLTVAMHGYGIGVLTQPWNPYLPLVAWTVAVLAAWMAVEGDHLMLVPLVIAGSFCAQTHVPYLSLGVGLFGFAAAVTGYRWYRGRREVRWSLLWSVAVGFVVWLPPIIDQLVHDPGNIRMLQQHFMNPPEEPIGVGEGVRLLLRHLDLLPALKFGAGGFLEQGSSGLAGLVLLLVWAASVVVAWRMRHRALLWLHATLAVVLVLETLSMARIFGKVWYYLTLWAWSITLAMAFAAVASFVVALGRDQWRKGALIAAGLLGVYGFVSLVVDAADADVPESQLSAPLGELIDPTVAALDASGRYVVTWTDAAFFGSQGYGLVNELERAGLDVGVDPTFRVPVTPQRVVDRADVTAEVHLSTGGYIDEWRARPDAEEIAFADTRTPAEIDEFDALHDEVLAGLDDAGLDDLVDTLDTNLFGVSLDPRVPTELAEKMARMLIIGVPAAVFVTTEGLPTR
jgi:hypothetical protein